MLVEVAKLSAPKREDYMYGIELRNFDKGHYDADYEAYTLHMNALQSYIVSNELDAVLGDGQTINATDFCLMKITNGEKYSMLAVPQASIKPKPTPPQPSEDELWNDIRLTLLDYSHGEIETAEDVIQSLKSKLTPIRK